MANYARWGPHVPKSRLPPTPPDYANYYLTSNGTLIDESDKYYSSGRPYSSRHVQSSRSHGSRYEQLPAYSAHHPHGRSKQMNGSEYTATYPQSLPLQYQYAPPTIPILPPIQAPGELPYHAYSHAHPEPKQKEDKPTGGVAQHLDYEMDTMSDFVAEMCQSMVTRTSAQPTSQFRKYVSQILSSTRLPSSTIMLGLFYLQERMKIELVHGSDLSSPSTLMKMLTVCLLLGSKFLDDNTFQNRSWAEVSNIAVTELNEMELKWLISFDWEIHGMMYDEHEGFFMWIEHWHAYRDKAQARKAKEAQKLAPLNTNIARLSATQQPLLSPDGPIPPQYQHVAQYDPVWARPQFSDYSPPSAPYSGPTTPEHYNNWHYASIPDVYSRASWAPTTKIGYGAQRPHMTSYNVPYYNLGYTPLDAWPHGQSCTCSLCIKQPGYYLDSSGYPVQTAAG